MVTAINDTVWPSVEADIRKSNPQVSDALLEEFKRVELSGARSMVAKLVGVEAQYYAETFTAEELQDILDFYRSPAGTKMISSKPQLMAKMMPEMIEQSKVMQAEMMEQMKQAVVDKGLKF